MSKEEIRARMRYWKLQAAHLPKETPEGQIARRMLELYARKLKEAKDDG